MYINVKLEADNAKLHLCKTGQLNIIESELNDHNVAVSTSFDESWNIRS